MLSSSPCLDGKCWRKLQIIFLSLSFCSSKVGHKGPVLSTHNPLGVATPKNITPTMFNLMKRDKDKDGGRKEKKEGSMNAGI